MNPKGIAAAVSAFVLWGLTPLYWYPLRNVDSVEIILHRVWWAFLLAWAIFYFRRRKAAQPKPAAIPGRRVLLLAAAAGVLVTLNWFIYIWAVNNGHIVEASLGYYMNPLVNVALGTIVLKERLSRMQTAALVAAGVGVVYLTVRLGTLPWISLSLAVSFGLYGLIKKRIEPGPLHSLALETTPLALPALAFVIVKECVGTGSLLSGGVLTAGLLVGAGAVTVVPLLLFGYATRAIRLADVGFFQYIAPTMMLLISIFVFGDPLDPARLPGFICVWIGLTLYTVNIFYRRKAAAA